MMMHISSVFFIFSSLQIFLFSVLGKESINYGMEKAVLAYDMACDYEWSLTGCQGKQTWLRDVILNRTDMPTPAIKEKYFGPWTKDKVLNKLPKLYQNKCEQYLSDSNAKPEVDEKEELQDAGNEYPYKAYSHCLITTLREISKGTLKRDWSLVYFGMEKAVKAFEMACAYEVTNFDCEGAQKRIQREMLVNPNLKNQTKKQIKYFDTWSKQQALSKLPKLYHDKCGKYLSDPEAKPPAADESNELNDKGKDYFFKGYGHCLIHTLRDVSKGVMKRDWNYLSFGMDKAVEAYDMACDYDVSNYKCDGQQDLRRKKIMDSADIKNQTKNQIKHFGLWTRQNAITKLASQYKQKCEQYLKDAVAESPVDESKELKDNGQDYPFKAYAYCLVHTLREISKGTMKQDWNMLTVGMEKVVLAYDKACEYELTEVQCRGKQAFVRSQVLKEANFRNQPKLQLRHFGAWSKDNALPKLPKLYKEKCEKYAVEPEAKPVADKSKELKDDGKDYFFRAYAHCLVQVLREKSGGRMSRDWSMLYYGMEKAVVAFNLACDYELSNVKCEGEQARMMREMLNNPNLQNQTKKQIKYFGAWTKSNALVDLSKPYQDKCGAYLSDADAKPPADESKELKDKGKDYFFKAYAHCLVSTLREISKGAMRRDPKIIKLGMEKVGLAYDMACNYAVSHFNCEGEQARMRKKMAENKAIKGKMKQQIKFFEKLNKQLALPKLPKPYQDKCGQYLAKPEAAPPADESKELNDEGEEYPFKALAHCLMNILRQLSNGVMKQDWSMFYFGMEKVVKAHDMACDYEFSLLKCEGKQLLMLKEMLKNPSLKNQTKKQIKHFGMWSKDNALVHLPKPYQEKCAKYLLEPEGKPASDESKELNDGGKNYFFRAYAYCLVKVLKDISKGEMKRDYSLVYFGMQKAVEAYDLACDYDVLNFKCGGEQLRIMREVLKNPIMKNNTKKQIMYFGSWTKQNALGDLSKSYSDKCAKYLSDPMGKPPADESKELNDAGKAYFFRAYAYCLMQNLREISKGKIRRDWRMLDAGMESSIPVFDRVCMFEVSADNCEGEQERVRTEVLSNPGIQNDTKKQVKYFGLWTQHNALSDLPKEYQDKCEKFLSDPDMQPEVDESKELDDKGQDYFFKGYAHCLIHTMRERSNGSMTRDWDKIFVGMEKANFAYELVCLYETSHTNKCAGQLRKEEMFIRRIDAYKNATYKLWKRYGARALDKSMPQLPEIYTETCSDYLEDPLADVPNSSGDDGLHDSGMDYPYKAFAHCLMQTMVKKNGGKMPTEVETAQVIADAPEDYDDK